jgi:hypothetical protein
MEDKLIRVKPGAQKQPETKTPSMKQSSGSGSNSLVQNDAPRNKDEALVHQLNLLAVAFNEPLTADRIKIYIMALSDLSASQLTHGLNRAVRELTFWPRPAELRELCTGVRARKSDTLRADEAWQWVMTHLDRHGVQGRTVHEFQGRTDFVFRSGYINFAYQGYCDRKFSGDVFTISAPFYVLTTIYPPEIPKLIAATLTQLGGSVSSGLKRLADAREAAEPVPLGRLINRDKYNAKEISFVRKDFTEFFLNAAALEAETSAPATIEPSRQLAGEVPASPTVTRLPIKLYFEGDSLRYEILSLEAADHVHAAGDLDEDAYAQVSSHWEGVQQEQDEQRIPKDYWACFVPHRGNDVMSSRGIPKPTEGTAVFRIESFDGGGVVYKGKLLRLEAREVKVGDKFHIRVSPQQLEAVPSIAEVEVQD